MLIRPDDGYNLLREVRINTNIQSILTDLNENISVPGNYEFSTPENFDGIRKDNINVSNIMYYDITKFYWFNAGNTIYSDSYNQDGSSIIGNYPLVDDSMLINIVFEEPSSSINKTNNLVLITIGNENNYIKATILYNNSNNSGGTSGNYYTFLNYSEQYVYYIYYRIGDNNYIPIYYFRVHKSGGVWYTTSFLLYNAQLFIPSNENENDDNSDVEIEILFLIYSCIN